MGLDSLAQPVPLGVALGLFLGKQGVFGFAWLAIKAGVATLPRHASYAQLYGVALLCGIGFTMSLFIGALAFTDPAAVDATKLGVDRPRWPRPSSVSRCASGGGAGGDIRRHRSGPLASSRALQALR